VPQAVAPLPSTRGQLARPRCAYSEAEISWEPLLAEIYQRRTNMQGLVRRGSRAYRVVSHVPFCGSFSARFAPPRYQGRTVQMRIGGQDRPGHKDHSILAAFTSHLEAVSCTPLLRRSKKSFSRGSLCSPQPHFSPHQVSLPSHSPLLSTMPLAPAPLRPLLSHSRLASLFHPTKP
jgi:hypothetical protein